MIIISDAWKTAYPEARVGMLELRGVVNPEQHLELDRCKAELENQLRTQFSGYTRVVLAALPSIQPYVAYYGRFKKTYHVQLQLESVALRGKSLPRVAALVEAMFMAELKNQLLTAGHDAEAIQGPLYLDVARGEEAYTLLNGQTPILKVGDMFIHDSQGVISSILYGPDQRTRITPRTRQVLFVVYAPPGVGAQAVAQHLADLEANVRIIAPEAKLVSQAIYEGGGMKPSVLGPRV